MGTEKWKKYIVEDKVDYLYKFNYDIHLISDCTDKIDRYARENKIEYIEDLSKDLYDILCKIVDWNDEKILHEGGQQARLIQDSIISIENTYNIEFDPALEYRAKPILEQILDVYENIDREKRDEYNFYPPSELGETQTREHLYEFLENECKEIDLDKLEREYSSLAEIQAIITTLDERMLLNMHYGNYDSVDFLKETEEIFNKSLENPDEKEKIFREQMKILWQRMNPHKKD